MTGFNLLRMAGRYNRQPAAIRARLARYTQPLGDSPILAVSTMTDPYILEQACAADEEWVLDDCPDCGHTPCLCDTEPEDASMVTGWTLERGPSYE